MHPSVPATTSNTEAICRHVHASLLVSPQIRRNFKSDFPETLSLNHLWIHVLCSPASGAAAKTHSSPVTPVSFPLTTALWPLPHNIQKLYQPIQWLTFGITSARTCLPGSFWLECDTVVAPDHIALLCYPTGPYHHLEFFKKACPNLLSCCCDKHHSQKEQEEKGFISAYNLWAIIKES